MDRRGTIPAAKKKMLSFIDEVESVAETECGGHHVALDEE